MKIEHRKIYKNGLVEYSTKSLMEMLYNNIDINNSYVPENNEIQQYNKKHINLLEPKLNFEKTTYNSGNWFFPDYYKNLNLEEYFLTNFPNDNKERILLEINEFKNHKAENLLKWAIWFSNELKKHEDWIIGIGRGSSCACYLLYLLDINLVNPLEYNLDIKEFLK